MTSGRLSSSGFDALRWLSASGPGTCAASLSDDSSWTVTSDELLLPPAADISRGNTASASAAAPGWDALTQTAVNMEYWSVADVPLQMKSCLFSRWIPAV